jgi:di/tricarboxylate transporter
MSKDHLKKVSNRYFQEALKGRPQTGIKKIIKLVIPVALLIFFTCADLPNPAQVRYTLGIFFFTALMWSFEAVPLPVTSLIVPVLLVAYGIFREARLLHLLPSQVQSSIFCFRQ